MLSYRHSFHAGNFADVLKHSVLWHCVDYLTQKEKPLRMIDTHAGAGIYSLTANHSINHHASNTHFSNKEYTNGIAKLWLNKDLPVCLANYVALINRFNTQNSLKIYPGSPAILQQALRDKDKLFCHELHPTDFRQLETHFSSDVRIKLVEENGLAGLQALVPPPDRRALVLIDPSYEIKSDYRDVIDAVQNAYKRFSTGTYLIWYPVVLRERIAQMQKSLVQSNIKNILQIEFGVAPDQPEYGMTASGLFVINPPWTLWSAMEETLPYLVDHLSESGEGFYRLDQLVAEN